MSVIGSNNLHCPWINY